MTDRVAIICLDILKQRLYESTNFATASEQKALDHAIFVLEERARSFDNTRKEEP